MGLIPRPSPAALALALGLCLIAADAFAANQFALINDADETIQGRCSNGTWIDAPPGATEHFTCRTALQIRVAGSPSEEAVSHSCAGGATQEITVTAVSGDTLEYSEACT